MIEIGVNKQKPWNLNDMRDAAKKNSQKYQLRNAEAILQEEGT